jgi:hypothetical protein
MTNFEHNKQWLIACGKTPTPENLSVAIGVQIEEFCEFLSCLRINNPDYAVMLIRTMTDLEFIGVKLKKQEQKAIIPVQLRADALDALCDIEVTGNGVAFLAGFDKDAADQDVLGSNDSKLENGVAVILPGGKIGKGKDYKAPDLKGFV